MKILILSTMYPNSKLYLSGVFVHKQVLALKKLGVNVTVIAPIPWSPFLISNIKEKWKKLAEVPQFEVIDGVTVYHPKYVALPKGIAKNYWSRILFISIKKVFKNHSELQKFDLIHVQGALPEDYTALLLSKYLNIPYVLTVHGASIYFTIKNKRHFKKSKSAIEKADVVIGVSSKVVERVKKVTDRSARMEIIYNGFEFQEFPSSQSIEKSEGIKLLFGATIVERKGWRVLLQSFSKIARKYNNVKLWIAGGGEQFNEMKSLAKSLGILEKTELFGVVTHKKMLELMHACSLFVLPSWDEAFGVVYLEAMSYKKPIIGTLGEGINDIINNEENGLLVKTKNVDDLTEKLELLISDELLRKKLGEKGYETVKNMTWENNAKKTLEVYKSVLQRRS